MTMDDLSDEELERAAELARAAVKYQGPDLLRLVLELQRRRAEPDRAAIVVLVEAAEDVLEYMDDGGLIDGVDMLPLRDAVYAIRKAESALAQPAPKVEGETSDDVEAAIGPRRVVTERLTCVGCPALKTEYWHETLENDETDSGTSAHCAAADNRNITAYWRAGDAPPAWCPPAGEPKP